MCLAVLLSILLSACGDNVGGLFGGEESAGFTDIGAGLTGVQYSSLAWGDYDNDGDMDLALAGYDGAGGVSKVYRNDGGMFTDIGAGLVGIRDGDLAWGDYDSDGDLDLALAGCEDNDNGIHVSKVYRNDGGTFTDIGAGLAGADDCSLAWGDYDNDGDLDLALAGNSDSDYVSAVYRNDGGMFTDIGAGLKGVDCCSLAWGDYDGDGDLDLALAGRDSSTYVSKIYRNDGGTFTDIGAGLMGVYWCSLAWGDHDNDGDLDLTLAGYYYDGSHNFISKVYRNDGGTFTDTAAGLTGVYASSLAWGDYDNDGDLDLALAGYYYDGSHNFISKVCRNDSGTFTEIGAGLRGVSSSSLGWGDYDNDGDLDLALAGNSDGDCVSEVYRNDGRTYDNPPSPPAGLQASVSGSGPYDVTFSWDAAADTETPSPGLTYNLRVGTAPGRDDVMPAHAFIGGVNDGKRLIPAMGNVQHNLSWTVKGLAIGTYYWSVQAVDTAFAGSGWAAQQTVAVGAPEITTHPANETVTEGDTATFTVVATGSGLTYQWQESADGGSTWTDITGATSDAYSFTAQLADSGKRYKCVVTNASGSVESNAATLTVNAAVPAPAIVSVTADDPDDADAIYGLGDRITFVFNVDTNESLAVAGLKTGTEMNTLFSLSGGHSFGGDSDRFTLAWVDAQTLVATVTAVGTIDPFGGVTGNDITADSQDTRGLALGDIDGDGALDILAGNKGAVNRVYLGNGDGTFAAGADIAADTDLTEAIVLGDVDGDGDLDVLAGNNGTNRLYLNNGNGTFAAGSNISTDAHHSKAIVLGDVDGDDDLDVVAGNDWDPNRLYLNHGDGAFAAGTDIDADPNPTAAIALGDVDRDGDLDIVVGNSASQKNRVYLNNGGGTFAAGADIAADAVPTEAITLGDVDGDGNLDVVAGNWGAPNRLYLGSGDGTFSPGTDIAADVHNTWAVALGDMDGDGDLDVVAGNTTNGVGEVNRLYLGKGDGTFAAGTDIAFDAHRTHTIGLGDLDGDGDLDVAAGNWGAPNRLYLNDRTADVSVGDTVTVLAAAGIKDVAGISPACTDTSPPITGDWGDPEAARIWRVDCDVAASGDGRSWATAFKTVQEAMAAASSGEEVWVAEGTYTNNGGGTATVLVMADGVDIYGGFAGTESARDQRNPTAHQTILDGENTAYHVVTGASNATLDGFTVTRGNASGSGEPDERGAGVYNNAVAALDVANCVFSSNNSTYGSGIFSDWSSSLSVSDCLFISNAATEGAAIYNYRGSTPTIINCAFTGNSATVRGGAVMSAASSSPPLVVNCVFTGNSAANGGAIDCYGNPCTVINCVLWQDTAPTGPEICLESGGTCTVSYSNIQGGYAGTGNIDLDPLFVDVADPDGPDDIFGTADDGLRLRPGSPCIDSADGDAAPATDILGNPRHDDPGVTDTGVGAIAYADMGAYEFQGDSSLVGWWKFDETSGTTAADSSGNGNDGTLSGFSFDTSSLAGKLGRALSLDGVDDVVEVPHNSDLNIFPVSINAWLQTTVVGPVGVVTKYLNASDNGFNFSLMPDSGNMTGNYFRAPGSSVGYFPRLEGGPINDGLWHHVVFTVDDSGALLYVDGTQVGSATWVGTPGPTNTTEPVRLGSSHASPGPDNHFDGLLDDVRIYDRVLSAAEVQALYQEGQ